MVNVEDQVKAEATVPVQSRVDIRTLAELDKYWKSQGMVPKSMSQLIAWSLDQFRALLSNTDMLPEKVDSIANAHRYVSSIGLYQRSMRKRSIKKIVTAIGFENLRAEGDNPEEYAPSRFKELHGNRSLEQPHIMSDERSKMIDEAVSRGEEEERKEKLNRRKNGDYARPLTDEELDDKAREINKRAAIAHDGLGSIPDDIETVK